MKALLLKGSRYWHTLRYLRWVQIVGRVKHKFRRPVINDSPVKGLSVAVGEWMTPAQRGQRMLNNKSFSFLNEKHDIVSTEDWNNDRWSKLWLYNLHYFDDLTATNARQRVDWHVALIDRWVDENLPGEGNGWEPYPSSLRIVNWIKWALAGNVLDDRWSHSLAVQVRFLRQNLETHLLGNHLFANAKALVFAGLFIDDDEASEWVETGRQLIERELPEQVLKDGGNFELSTMYHQIFLEDLLDIINIHRVYDKPLPRGLVERIPLMFTWSETMCHPDGEISFFNDAAFGITPSVCEIQEYGTRLCLFSSPNDEINQDGLTTLDESGYSRVQLGGMVALIDRAAVGPDYLPGHAHADTLSFELSLFGKRCIVNSGTSVYGVGSDRLRQRGTAAHSTVVIDGKDSSEVWSGFRVARRARVFDCSENQGEGKISLSACHSGYKRLSGKPVHCREWVFEEGMLTVVDKITGKGKHRVESVLPLHPDVEIRTIDNAKATLEIVNKKVVVAVEGDGELDVTNSNYHPEFGVSVANNQLVFQSVAELPIEITTRISW